MTQLLERSSLRPAENTAPKNLLLAVLTPISRELRGLGILTQDHYFINPQFILVPPQKTILADTEGNIILSLPLILVCQPDFQGPGPIVIEQITARQQSLVHIRGIGLLPTTISYGDPKAFKIDFTKAFPNRPIEIILPIPKRSGQSYTLELNAETRQQPRVNFGDNNLFFGLEKDKYSVLLAYLDPLIRRGDRLYLRTINLPLDWQDVIDQTGHVKGVNIIRQ